jgi:hypothetical protein
MSLLRLTLLSEGSSDKALLPVLEWSVREVGRDADKPQWADLRNLRDPPKALAERIAVALELYPCDLLFVHRDADRTDRETRTREIRAALVDVSEPPAVCVVPIRMLEAWFLFDKAAIRRAAGNPRGRVPLVLPAWREVEEIPDPKERLLSLLRIASELGGRRLRQLDPGKALHLIANFVDDFSPLRALPAFRAFE